MQSLFRRWIRDSNTDRFDHHLAYSIDVVDGKVTKTDLLGGLKLDASIGSGKLARGEFTFRPRFVSETGLTLVRSRTLL